MASANDKGVRITLGVIIEIDSDGEITSITSAISGNLFNRDFFNTYHAFVPKFFNTGVTALIIDFQSSNSTK